MSLQQAIERRVRLGLSFCSYRFKPLHKSGKSFIVHAERDKDYLLNNSRLSSTKISSSNTIQLQQSRFKSSSRRSINDHNKKAQKQNYVHQYKSSDSIKVKKSKRTHKPSFQNNKMDQYLSDFFTLKSGFPIVNAQFQTFDISTRPNFNGISQFSNSKFQLQQVRPQNFLMASCVQQIRKYQIFKYPQLFYDYSLCQNQTEKPFKILRIVNLAHRLYIEKETSKKFFEGLPIKHYCQALNNYSTKIEQNIFYIAMSKEKEHSENHPYSQGFFWISKPIKHHQRFAVLNIIKLFLKQVLLELSVVDNQKQILGPKVWIIDSRGKISFIKKQQVQTQIIETAKMQYSDKQNAIPCKNNNQVCLSMFISSINRGCYLKQSTFIQNFDSRQNNQ